MGKARCPKKASGPFQSPNVVSFMLKSQNNLILQVIRPRPSCGTFDLPTLIAEDDDKLKIRVSLISCLQTSTLWVLQNGILSSRPSPWSKASRISCIVTAQIAIMRLWQIKVKSPCRVPRSYWQAEAVLAGLGLSYNPSHEAQFYP